MGVKVVKFGGSSVADADQVRKIRDIVMADPELNNLGECFERIYNGETNIVPWVNKDPMSIINLVDNFIQENWYK